MKPPFKFITGILLLALAAAGCSSQGDSPAGGSSVERRDPEEVKVSVAETAAALNDPARVADGVMSLLAHLGIGVYSSQIEQIMPGTETNPDDFWLYDFELEALEKMALASPQPFSDYHLFLTQFIPDLTIEELAQAYTEMYAADPDYFLSAFFKEMDVELTPESEITQLVQWLLFLDGFVPPNGGPSAQISPRVASLPGLVPMYSVSPQGNIDEICKAIKGIVGNPFWGFADTMTSFTQLVLKGASFGKGVAGAVVDPKNIIHALMLQAFVETTLKVTSQQVHEVHSDGEFLKVPGKLEFTAKAEFLMDSNDFDRCGILARFGFDIPKKGPVEGMQFAWDFAPVFGEHGSFSTVDSAPFHLNLSNSSGERTVTYQANTEDADGDGDFKNKNGTITVTYRVQMGDVFNLWAGVQEIFVPRTETTQINIGWHEVAWKVTITVDIENSSGQGSNIGVYEGLFVVLDDGSLDGEGFATITGHDPGAGCIDFDAGGTRTITIDYTASFPFEISGKKEPRLAGGDQFNFVITGGEEDTFNLTVSDCVIEDDSLLSGFVFAFFKTPNILAVGELILGRAEPGATTINNNVLGGEILVTVETVGTGE